jgi:pullulanase
MMRIDLLERRRSHFVLWRPARPDPPPRLVIGRLRPGNPPAFVDNRSLELAPLDGLADLWGLAAADCGLDPGTIYHYWFEVTDSDPFRSGRRILVTDPLAAVVDWRLRAPRLPPPYTDDDRDPAAVVLWDGSRLETADPGGERPPAGGPGGGSLAARAPNHRLVIYELPTAWSTRTDLGGVEIGVGTFRDVLGLVEDGGETGNFGGVEVFEGPGRYLVELGVNALELLPPADSWVFREWGYATSNYFAADFDLGFPISHASPTATTDLVRLVQACHRHGIRFFLDVVMAFATRYAYQNINYLDFHVRRGAPGHWGACQDDRPSEDPEDRDHEGRCRQDFGGALFKFGFFTRAYDPVSGAVRPISPARQLLLALLSHWMTTCDIDGVRVDSTKNIVNWDFLEAFAAHGRAEWRERWARAGEAQPDADARFLVVGEELPPRLGLVTSGRLDGLWNEPFLERVRAAILGQTVHEDRFDDMLRAMIDCRRLGYPDGAAAVNYVTSHDVEGFRKERLFRFLVNNGIGRRDGGEPDTDAIARRIRLAFVCLLTAVGVPMIFAGEEFGDDHDRAIVHPAKQSDPVNFDRLGDEWRRDLARYVARLVRLRTSSDALSVNDTAFIHVDLEAGRRVVAWQRGRPGVDRPVVVVANFSDFRSDAHGSPPFEYRVNGWPARPPGTRWREITQERDVPDEWAGREPIFPWEAKVYAAL